MNIEKPKTTSESNRLGEFTNYYEKLDEKRCKRKIDPLQFRGHPKFTDAEIVGDLTKAERAIEDFNRVNEGLTEKEAMAIYNGSITETILCQNIEDGGLFGKNAHLEITSDFDDVFNHVDALVFVGPEENDDRPDGVKTNTFGLAFDFSSTAEDACKKLRQTLEHTVMKGWAPSVKYAKMPDGTLVKNMWVAKVIIGAERESVAELADLIINDANDNPDKPISSSVSKTFEQHRIKNIINDEILNQLIAFRNIAYAFADVYPKGSIERERVEKVGKMYHRAYVLFNKILEENDFDPHQAKIARDGDKMASALHGMIAASADPNKKISLDQYIANMRK